MITIVKKGADEMFYPMYCKKSWFFTPWKHFQKVRHKQSGYLQVIIIRVNFFTEKEANIWLTNGTVEELLKSI